MSEIFDNFLKKYQIYDILDKEFFKIAVTHKSISKKNSYERLEFLGDTLLGFAIGKILFDQFPLESEGSLSKKKSFLASREIAFQIAQKIELDTKILSKINPPNQNIIAGAFESFLAVIYIEYGLEIVFNVIQDLVFPFVDQAEDEKTKLQELCQKMFQSIPKYSLVKKEGKDHDPSFTVSLAINNFYAEASSTRKQVAEKKVAKIMLNILQNQQKCYE